MYFKDIFARESLRKSRYRSVGFTMKKRSVGPRVLYVVYVIISTCFRRISARSTNRTDRVNILYTERERDVFYVVDRTEFVYRVSFCPKNAVFLISRYIRVRVHEQPCRNNDRIKRDRWGGRRCRTFAPGAQSKPTAAATFAKRRFACFGVPLGVERIN